jgi:hypothetical protein
MRTSTPLFAIYGLCFLTPIHAQEAQTNRTRWNLVNDISATGNQISFNQGSQGVWYFMASSSLEHDPLSYKLIPQYDAPCLGNPAVSEPIGVSCWEDPAHTPDHSPLIAFNFTNLPQVLGAFTMPPRSLALHPAPDRLAIVAWKSPIGGRITVSGSFADLNPTCGDGVRWSLDSGSTSLDAGIIDATSQDFYISRLSVSPDQILYFTVDPNGNYVCDSTQLIVTITRANNETGPERFP